MAKVKKFSQTKIIFQAKKGSKNSPTKNFSARYFPIGPKKNSLKPNQSLLISKLRILDSYLSLGVGLILIFFLVTYVIVNIKLPLQITLAANPNNIDYNLTLADQLIQQGQFPQAELVLRFIQQQTMKNKVLGWNESANEENLNQLWQKKHLEDPQDIKLLISKWETFVQEKPNYRDAYIQLSLLYRSLNNISKAENNIDRALEIDPNNETAIQIKNSL